MRYVKHVLCRGIPRMFVPNLLAWDAGDGDGGMSFLCTTKVDSKSLQGLRLWAKQARRIKEVLSYLEEHLPYQVKYETDELLLGLEEDDTERAFTDMVILVGIMAFVMQEDTYLTFHLANYMEPRQIRLAAEVNKKERRCVPFEDIFTDQQLEGQHLKMNITPMQMCSPDVYSQHK